MHDEDRPSIIRGGYGKGLDADAYCRECGGHKTWFAAHNEARCTNVSCKVNRVDWSGGATEPGPVRMPTRAEIMADARRGHWHPLPAPYDRDVIMTRRVTNQAGEDFWIVDRRRAKPGMDDYLNGRLATHWCEDIIGTPHMGDAAT